MNPPKPPPLIADFHRVGTRIDTELRVFVRADIEDEIARMRRRFHIHAALIGCVAVLTFLTAFSIVDATVMVGSSVCAQYIQEYLDYVGKF
jgi:hypothetical protein